MAPSRAAAAKLNEALEKVVPIRDWIDAGLPAGATESRYFIPHTYWEGADACKSTRFDGKGFVDLTIATPEVAQQRLRDWRKVSLTLSSSGTNQSRSWCLLAKQYRDSVAHEPVGLVLHDGVWIEISPGRSLSREQAASLEGLMKASADRLAVACDAELRPYIERINGRAGAPR